MTTEAAIVTGPPTAELLCPECGHLNPGGIDRCNQCQKHLFIKCRECGHVNFRAQARCEECLSPMRHSHVVPPLPHHLYWPYCWRYDPHRNWIIPAQLLAFVVAVCVTVSLAVNFSTYFQKAQRFLFSSAFEAYPVNMPLRIAIPVDILTAALFVLVPVSILALSVWLTKQSLIGRRRRSFSSPSR
jgi:hypothetical protein